MRIRDAVDADWNQIWPIIHTVVAAGDTFCWPTNTTEAEAKLWWTGKSAGRAFVAEEEDGRILGTAELHPNQLGGGSHVANAGFMVASDAAGHGVGRALAVHVIDQARADGFRSMQFNAVVASNVGAVHLWESVGFSILATVPEAFDHPALGPVGLHIMYRKL
jgi:L-amino acid N-acyltransferase YncA